MNHVLKDKSLLVLIFFKGYVCIPRFTPVYVLLCRKVYARLVESGTLQRHKTMGIFCPLDTVQKRFAYFRAFSRPRRKLRKEVFLDASKAFFYVLTHVSTAAWTPSSFCLLQKKLCFSFWVILNGFFVREILWSTFNVGKIVTTHGLLY